MFDNPYLTERPPQTPGPRLNPRAALFICAVSLALGSTVSAMPRAATGVVSSPSHLRQVEIVETPTQIAFYLQNAGYRLLHKPQLIARVTGGGLSSVTWPAADAVSIAFAHPWSHLTQGQPQGITVALTATR